MMTIASVETPLEQYNRAGYALFKNVLDSQLIEEAGRHVEWLQEKNPDLRPEHLIVIDVDGKVVEGNLSPSSDTASHLYIYRQRPDVGGIVHTHSPYATAFAAVNKPIPVVLTAIADEFGGPIPCGSFALIGGEEIGKVVVESIGRSVAVLLKNHGVFTIGKNAESAVKAAVMVEDVARTVWIALQIGTPDEIPAEQVAKLHDRYTNVYGQR